MAFNFRPKSKKEIISKKKKFSKQVAEVYEHINKSYAETIVLDPTSTFSKVKIPRVISDKKNINQIKNELAKVSNIKGLSIEFGDGSGAGGSNINAAETAFQENASRMVCEFYISNGRMPNVCDIKKIYKKCDDDWYGTFYKQAIASKKFLSGKGYKFSRDQGIMPFLEKTAMQRCGVTKKDSWNPADIYAVKASQENTIRNKIREIGDLKCDPNEKLDILNEAMRVWFKSRELVGISLKKIAPNKNQASLEETNAKSNKDVVIKNIKIDGKVNCNLDLNVKGEFSTGELMFKLNVEGKSVTVQIRAFSGGQRENTQMDMSEAGAAAKLGKVSLTQAIDPYLASKPIKRLMANTLPKVGNWTEGDIRKYVAEYKSVRNLKIGGSAIDFGINDWENTLRKAIEIETSNARTASQLSTKLQCFQWIRIFNQFKGNEFNKFITVLYFGAKKQYASAGPFLKIS
jgi:hypothetical protein